MPFIWHKNIGLYTSVKPCVPEEKQDQSPSPLCVVIKPTAGSSHYAIRASRRTWSVALQGPPPHLSARKPFSSPQHLYIVKKQCVGPNSPAAKQTDGFESVCCETLWCNTSSLPPPQCTFSHSASPTVSAGPRWGKMSTRGFRFSKIHTSLLYLTGNYMEMWHNGDQASGATIAAGATTLRANGATSDGFITSAPSSLLPPLPSPPPSLSLTHSPASHSTGQKRYVRARILMLCRSEVCPHHTKRRPVPVGCSTLLAKISCLTAELPAVNTGQITAQTTHTHTQLCSSDRTDKLTSNYCQQNNLLPAAYHIDLD